MPEVSVIIPVYNVEAYLEECLDSVLNQTHCDFEVIAIDDGSTDNSAAILSMYSLKNSKIKVITTVNQGLSMARNTGLEASTGDYIIFLDSDDKFSEKTLEICVQRLKQQRLDAVFFESDIIIDGVDSKLGEKFDYERPPALFDKIITGEIFFSESVESKKYIAQACMYMFSREALGHLRFYPGIYHEDELFTTQLLLSGQLKRVGCLQETLFQRRLRPNSIMTQNKSRKHVYDYLTVAKELIKYKKIISNSSTDHALTIFVNRLLHGVLFCASNVSDFFIPLSLKIEILKISLSNSSFGKFLLLSIHVVSPSIYAFLASLKKAVLIKSKYSR